MTDELLQRVEGLECDVQWWRRLAIRLMIVCFVLTFLVGTLALYTKVQKTTAEALIVAIEERAKKQNAREQAELREENRLLKTHGEQKRP